MGSGCFEGLRMETDAGRFFWAQRRTWGLEMFPKAWRHLPISPIPTIQWPTFKSIFNVHSSSSFGVWVKANWNGLITLKMNLGIEATPTPKPDCPYNLQAPPPVIVSQCASLKTVLKCTGRRRFRPANILKLWNSHGRCGNKPRVLRVTWKEDGC